MRSGVITATSLVPLRSVPYRVICIAGLAGVSIVVNAFTLLVLAAYVHRNFFVPRTEYTPALQRTMVVESFPLMLNHLLATLFFKIDVPLLRTLRGDAEVGRYGTAYKFLGFLGSWPHHSGGLWRPIRG